MSKITQEPDHAPVPSKEDIIAEAARNVYRWQRESQELALYCDHYERTNLHGKADDAYLAKVKEYRKAHAEYAAARHYLAELLAW